MFQVNDQPISAQNTLQRQHMSQDLRLPPRWSERLSAMTTSDNHRFDLQVILTASVTKGSNNDHWIIPR